MMLSEFLDAVMPTVGELCGPGSGCGDWSDHLCTSGTAIGTGRCLRHCTCQDNIPGEPGSVLAYTCETPPPVSLVTPDPPDTVYVICPTCTYERRAGQECGLPCV